MHTQLARVEQDAPNAPLTQLAPQQMPTLILSQEKKDLLKRQYFKGATDDELELALAICGRMRLDPFARQIAFIKRWDSRERREVMTAQPTIDGARLLAQRSQHYGGQLGPWWCGPDGVWHDVWLSDELPVAAKVGVINTQFAEPLFAVAKFSSYAAKTRDGKLTPIWAQMPDLMVSKCAEMLALRRAFPAEFSDFGGVDSSDESAVGQMVTDAGEYIDVDGVVADSATGEIVATDETKTQPTQADAIKRLHAIGAGRGLSHEHIRVMAHIGFHVESLTELGVGELAQLAEKIEQGEQAAIDAFKAQHESAQKAASEPVADVDQDAALTDETPVQEFARRLRAASTKDEFEQVAQAMSDGGVWTAELAALQAEKRQELGLPGPKTARPATPVNDLAGPLLNAPVPREGEPGDDRFTH